MSDDKTFDIHFDPETGDVYTDIEGYGNATCDQLAEVVESTQTDTKVTKTQSIGDDDGAVRGEHLSQG